MPNKSPKSDYTLKVAYLFSDETISLGLTDMSLSE